MTHPSGLLAAAVADNLRWCATVAATDAVADRAGTWRAPHPPHPLFPDLVTTRPSVAASAVASRLAARPRCSVKDSFADLDLTGDGFSIAFDAEWIGLLASTLTPTGPLPVCSEIISTTGLRQWSDAAGLPVPLPARVLSEPTTTVLADDAVPPERGLVVTATPDVIGVSNVFAKADVDVWPWVVSVVRAMFPDRAIVGYESGSDLHRALAAGFRSLGPLRVWTRDR